MVTIITLEFSLLFFFFLYTLTNSSVLEERLTIINAISFSYKLEINGQ